jgi:hypothetical protein|tara:strand:+ start:113 stop:490 length:378 start_codon:yes stop_codon:yes gene_type:complete
MAKSVLPNNGLALCVIIIVIVGLFLHYELGYNFELFNVGGKSKGKGRWGKGHKKHKPWYHPHTWFTHNVYTTHTHPQNITVSKKALFGNYDLDNSGQIEENEFYSAVEGDLGNKINDKNKYTFTA